MCEDKSTCTHPENLQEDPKDCSAEQIAICHPGEKGHPFEVGDSVKK